MHLNNSTYLDVTRTWWTHWTIVLKHITEYYYLFYLKFCYLHVKSELIQSNIGTCLKYQPNKHIGYLADVHNPSINPDSIGYNVVTNKF